MRDLAIKLACLLIILFVSVAISGQTMPIAQNTGVAENTGVVDWSPVEQAMGVHGDIHPDGTVKFSIPRNLNVTVDGVKLAPGADMSSDFSFMKAGNETMMVGEIMVKDDEVANTTRMLASSGIEETALHNHLLHMSPHIMWLHVHGYGDAVEIAKAIHNITAANGGVFSMSADTEAPSLSMDTAKLDSIIGYNGTQEDGVYAFSIPRNDEIRMNGMVLPPEMDISTEISFQPLGDGKSAAIGEFVLETNEVEPVLHSLSGNGIEVTALHSHMLTEEPRLFYLHCWAKGDTEKIAQAFHEALKKTNSKINS